MCVVTFRLLADAGWQNRIFNGGGYGGVFDIFVGAGNGNCTKGSDVGNMTVSCTDTGSSSSNVTFSDFVQQPVTLPVSHFYLGCIDISKCGPPQFMKQVSGDVPCTTNTRKCGGTVDTTMFVGSTGTNYTLNCTCSSVRWAFHQSGSFFVQDPPPVNGICPPPK